MEASLETTGISPVRIRLDLAYDGGEFAGWATQPGLRTVQGELETALGTILRAPVRVTVAGRTDAGVHAISQVVHFDIDNPTISTRDSRSFFEVLTDRLFAVLPGDIVVRRATEVPSGFDARFSAGSRRYVFRIDDGGVTPAVQPVETPQWSVGNPLLRGHVLRHRGRLDVDAMDTASRQLVGLQDFAAFCKQREGATTIRRLISFAWRRPTSGPDAGLVVGTIRADAFCHNMVRALVGSIIKVGEGREPVTWPYQVLVSANRANAAAIVPPHGLTLEAITYPPPPYDAERATQIRAKRTL